MAVSLVEVFKALEGAPDEEILRGLVDRYSDQLTDPEGTQALIERLEQRRKALNRWRGMRKLIDRLRWEKQATMRHDLEAATQSVLRAESFPELASVARRHPVVFSGTMISSMKMLQEEALKAGDDYTARLATSRLRNLQLLHLANAQGMEVTEESLKFLVMRILEAESFKDLLEIIEENPVVLVESFDIILNDIGQQGARRGKTRLPKVVKLRLDVFNALRRVVETFVLQRGASGDIHAAVGELIEATSADHFLGVVSRYPFILGEDFGAVLQDEIDKARHAGDDHAAQGIFRRKNHLRLIGNIIAKLSETQRAAEQRAREFGIEEPSLLDSVSISDRDEEDGDHSG